MLRLAKKDKSGAWTVSTLAGTGRQGHRDGRLEEAEFTYPAACAVDEVCVCVGVGVGVWVWVTG